MIWSLLMMLVLLACTTFVSGGETALFALSHQQRRAFAASTNPLKRRAHALMLHPRRVLLTVLIGNTASDICLFAVSYVTFSRLENSHPALAAAASVATLLAVILLGEILPKAIALQHAARLAPFAALFIHSLEFVLTPVRGIIHWGVMEPLTRLLSPSRRPDAKVSSDELNALVQLSAQQGVISTHEQDMLQAVVALPEITVRSVTVPRVDVQAIKAATSWAEARAAFSQAGLKKLLVYGRDLDDVRGVLYARDLFLNPGASPARLVRPVRYVPEVINLLQLIRYFRSTQSKFAVVVDEYGGVRGIVTIEDVLEEVVGELDSGGAPSDEPQVERLDEYTYRVPGRLSVRPWRQALGITSAFTDVDTLGGVVLASLGRLPRVGDEVRFGNVVIRVDRIEGRRIAAVLLCVQPAPPGKAQTP